MCENDDDFAQVLAANYAFATDAGLCLISPVEEERANELLERLYTAAENRSISTTALLESLRAELRQLAGHLPLPRPGAVTFISRRIPWGFAFPEIPSTHLFSYPDLGIALINGVTAEQAEAPGIRSAAILDPGAVDSREIQAAIERLTDRGVLSIGIRSKLATVHRVAQTIEHFPYDLLLISTHCGDASGWRWTYEFVDSEGIARTLVTDIAIGVQIVPGQDDLRVTQFERFVSLDGVDWNDPERHGKLYHGQAMRDFVRMKEEGAGLEPTRKEEIPRVPGSMALKMANHNYIALPQNLASAGSPIVINNACGSWHRLASTFMFRKRPSVRRSAFQRSGSGGSSGGQSRFRRVFRQAAIRSVVARAE